MAKPVQPVRWEPVVREEIDHFCALAQAVHHPLQQTTVISSTKSATNPAESEPSLPLDPLSALAAKRDPLESEVVDPLTALSKSTKVTKEEPQKEQETVDSTAGSDGETWQGGEKFVPWAVRKTQIVQTFTTTGTIQMPSFVSSEVTYPTDPPARRQLPRSRAIKLKRAWQVAKAGRGGNTLKARLASVEDGDDEVSMVRYNAREYVNNMTELNEEVTIASTHTTSPAV